MTFADSMFLSCDYVQTSDKLYNGVGVFTYLEQGPNASLANAEVVKLFGVFYNEEARAETVFGEIEVRTE